MDFIAGAGGAWVHPANIPLPFYMTYPGYFRQEQENAMIQDLEYLQRIYPEEVRGIAKRVAEILDKVDYEGSMIYDEYPDKYSICRLAHTINEILQSEEQEPEEAAQTEKWAWQEKLIQVLLGDEIYKRRHGGRRGKFGI
ncbi:MAG: hypothetical protein IJ833_11445 [Lachnospiraceae bacterium]|nr:hypothetical protein [Lachnospiraceae bacterium]